MVIYHGITYTKHHRERAMTSWLKTNLFYSLVILQDESSTKPSLSMLKKEWERNFPVLIKISIQDKLTSNF